MKQNIILDTCCAILAALFAYAGVSKLFDYQTFNIQLSQSPFISNFSHLYSWLLPCIEIITSLGLLFHHSKYYALLVSLFLLSLFTCYIIAMLHFSYYIPCSCGGVLGFLTWRQHVVFNLFFIGITLTALFLIGHHKMFIKKDTLPL